MRKRRTLLIAGILALLAVFVVHFLDFPGSVPRFKEISGGGVLLDQSPAFTADETYRRLSDYGEAGRSSYKFRNLTVDVILPLSLLPFLFLLMLKAVAPLRLNLFREVLLISIPFVYVIFDVTENVMVLVLLNKFPERMDLLAGIVPYITSIKRAALLSALFVPVVIFGVTFIRIKSNRRKKYEKP